MPQRKIQKTYQLKIVLDGITPPIWRRLLISEKATLLDLHDAIQAIMPWQDYHLHEFLIGGIRFGDPQTDEYHERDIRDEIEFSLRKLNLQVGDKFTYQYDFGDNWKHNLEVKQISPAVKGERLPKCTGGQRACPPEDVGSLPGYERFLIAINDPTDENHANQLEWVGGSFDPEAFDLEAAQSRLQDNTRRDWAGNLPAEAQEEARRQASLLDPFHWARYRRDDWEAQAKALQLRQQVVTLIHYINENKVTGTQSTGNFPRKAIAAIAVRFPQPIQLSLNESDRDGKPFFSEEEVWEVFNAHLLANGAALINGGPGRLWRISEAGEVFLITPAVGQIWVLFITWWYRINWMIASRFELSGQFLYEPFRNATSTLLKQLKAGQEVPFETFCNQLIEASGWTWDPGQNDSHSSNARFAIDDMIIEPLESLGILSARRVADPLLEMGIFQKPVSFSVTEFGEKLLQAV